MENKKNIIGKIVLQGKILCLSPLHIGSGNDENSDLDVLIDENGIAFIPATSFSGVLRHSIKFTKANQKKYNKELQNFWGFSEDNEGHQSSFICFDLVPPGDKIPKIVVRDGIRMDNSTGIVKDKGKYNYELVERNSIFNFRMEFNYKESNEEFIKRIIATIYDALKEKKIFIGAKTNSGFGEIELLAEKTKIYEFRFQKKRQNNGTTKQNEKTDVYNWLIQNYSDKNEISRTQLDAAFELENNKFSIDVDLKLNNSLIVRSYSTDPAKPDATHIKSADRWVLPGTSLKGAICARAERIVRTLGKPEEIIKKLFGDVDVENPNSKAIKGRVRINEVILPDFIAELQTRIKIDRFTGGTIDSALFDTMPLFTDFTEKINNVQIVIEDCKDYEAGLLLLVLKDLWSGDLAVGGEKNVGRGTFSGVSAIIKMNGKPVILNTNLNDLKQADEDILQNYVDKLISEN